MKVKTARGTLVASEYNDGIANGIRIELDGETLALIDVYTDGKTYPRVLIYDSINADEPSHCINIIQGKICMHR